MSWFHVASHLSQVPWREVEGHYSPGYEPASATQIYTAPSVLTRKYYRGWTLGMHVPAHAELEFLSDIQLGRVLVHHQYMLELPAGYLQHPDAADASQAVTVVAKATLKIKGLIKPYL